MEDHFGRQRNYILYYVDIENIFSLILNTEYLFISYINYWKHCDCCYTAKSKLTYFASALPSVV